MTAQVRNAAALLVSCCDGLLGLDDAHAVASLSSKVSFLRRLLGEADCLPTHQAAAR